MANITISANEMQVLRTIGETGLYESTDILSIFLDEMKRCGLIPESATRRVPEYALQRLIKKGVVERLDINNPMKHNYAAYRIVSGLEDAYEQLFGKRPVPSLLSGGIRDHATLEHYIGVVELEKFLRKSGNYFFISSKRSDCRMLTLSGLEYIPDIIAKFSRNGGGTGTAVFEYELNTHTQAQFEEKMDKAKGLHHIFKTKTSQINIVTNNDINADALRDKVQVWIDKTGTDRLEHVIIRITTLTRLAFNIRIDRLVNDKRSWRWIFNIQKKGRWAEMNKEKITR